MCTRILSDDVREFSIGELWDHVDELLAAKNLTDSELEVALDWCDGDLALLRKRNNGMVFLQNASQIFEALDYELSLTACKKSKDPLPKQRSSI